MWECCAKTLLGPRSRFGDKLPILGLLCPHLWDCGAERGEWLLRDRWRELKICLQALRYFLLFDWSKRILLRNDDGARTEGLSTFLPPYRSYESVLCALCSRSLLATTAPMCARSKCWVSYRFFRYNVELLDFRYLVSNVFCPPPAPWHPRVFC